MQYSPSLHTPPPFSSSDFQKSLLTLMLPKTYDRFLPPVKIVHFSRASLKRFCDPSQGTPSPQSPHSKRCPFLCVGLKRHLTASLLLSHTSSLGSSWIQCERGPSPTSHHSHVPYMPVSSSLESAMTERCRPFPTEQCLPNQCLHVIQPTLTRTTQVLENKQSLPHSQQHLT